MGREFSKDSGLASPIIPPTDRRPFHHSPLSRIKKMTQHNSPSHFSHENLSFPLINLSFLTSFKHLYQQVPLLQNLQTKGPSLSEPLTTRPALLAVLRRDALTLAIK